MKHDMDLLFQIKLEIFSDPKVFNNFLLFNDFQVYLSGFEHMLLAGAPEYHLMFGIISYSMIHFFHGQNFKEFIHN